jgi:hypothetical protein
MLIGGPIEAVAVSAPMTGVTTAFPSMLIGGPIEAHGRAT